MWRFVARRMVLSVLTIFLVVSVSFGVIALTPDPNLQGQLFALQRDGVPQDERQAYAERYREVRGRDKPLVDRYGAWIVNVATLDLGYSVDQQAPVTSLLEKRLPYTLGYVIPAMLLSFIAGVASGVWGALRDGARRERYTRYVTYIGFGIPNFVLGMLVLNRFGVKLGYKETGSVLSTFVPWSGLDPVRLAVPVILLATTLFAVQFRYARMESLNYLSDSYEKLLRAKGATRGDVARHAVRNTAGPLVSLFFAELVGVLVVSIYVIEAVFQIPGIGNLTLEAAHARDMPVVIGATLVMVVAVVAGNLIQEVAHRLLDPRIGNDS